MAHRPASRLILCMVNVARAILAQSILSGFVNLDIGRQDLTTREQRLAGIGAMTGVAAMAIPGRAA